MFFFDLFDYFDALFRQAFVNIPNQNELSLFYLIGNFLLLVFAGLSSGNFNILK